MTNPELINNLHKVVKALKIDDHKLADTLDYLVFIAKERLAPDN